MVDFQDDQRPLHNFGFKFYPIFGATFRMFAYFLIFYYRKRSLTTFIYSRMTPERGLGGCFPPCHGNHPLFS